MAITKTWEIKELEIRDSLLGMNNVVTSIVWCVKVSNDGVDGTTPINIILNGIAHLDLPNDTFTPYEQITQEQAMSWLMNSLGPEAKKWELEAVSQVIAASNTNATRPQLPWA